MLKYINIILGTIVATGIIYSSFTITTEPATVETPPEQPVIIKDFGTPLPGSEGDQWEEFNEFLGSIEDSTDQEQE
tara:strand:- start:83 stop:310 length:228 start_codon:yes stop_codon:yes gene_type:complete